MTLTMTNDNNIVYRDIFWDNISSNKICNSGLESSKSVKTNCVFMIIIKRISEGLATQTELYEDLSQKNLTTLKPFIPDVKSIKDQLYDLY